MRRLSIEIFFLFVLDISKTQSFTKLLFHAFIFKVIFCAKLFEDLLICKCLQIPLHNML